MYQKARSFYKLQLFTTFVKATKFLNKIIISFHILYNKLLNLRVIDIFGNMYNCRWTFINSKTEFMNLFCLRFIGFWITVRNEELALGKIGNPLTQPLITWNDTLREGPREPFYFGLTTDQVIFNICNCFCSKTGDKFRIRKTDLLKSNFSGCHL